MNFLLEIILVLFYVLAPTGILYLCYRHSFFNRIGAVILSYVVGIVLSQFEFLHTARIDFIQEILMSACIPLAIPLLLFSSDLKRSFLLARTTLLSLLAALISVVLVVVIGYIYLKPQVSGEFHKIGGLLVGVYTGGTPNLAALKMVLDVKPDVYIAVHTYDMLLSTLHLFFLMILGKKLFELVLPVFKSQGVKNGDEVNTNGENEFLWGLFKKENRIPFLKALGISLVIVALSGAVMLLMNQKYQMVVFILTITSLSLAASFNKTVKSIPKTFELGMYFILVFSVVVASKVQFENLVNINPLIFYYITFVVFGSLFLHVVISRFFKVDADTLIITSAALICSPPFVPVVAGSLKNKEIILPGITVGIIGYAIGNYLGFLISELLLLL
ncbi:DUF819 family protein [Labilibacter sediminis]|nr:DUF819 family protein [Labilibacter sediminis]